MCHSVLAAVEERAAGRPVGAVGVRVGERLAIVPEAFEQSFQLVAQGGVAEGARVEITTVPGEELLLEWLRYHPARDDAVLDQEV